ncbi:MAG: hypothetical protein WCO26_09830 [Deltaproteobacteria bacterium]
MEYWNNAKEEEIGIMEHWNIGKKEKKKEEELNPVYVFLSSILLTHHSIVPVFQFFHGPMD